MNTKWHVWFAWRPVKTLSGKWMWLKKVVRQYRMLSGRSGYVYSKIVVGNRIDDMVKNPFHQGHLRNKLCPCMSNKKLKNCHGTQEFIEQKTLDKFLRSMLAREMSRS